MIILDSCAVIQILRCNNKTRPQFLKKIPSVILLDIVLGEVQKVYWFKKNKNISYIDIIEKLIFFGASISVLETNKVTKKYAKELENKYDICHYPDSIILSAARFYKSSIMTLDKNMLKVAKFENIAIHELKKKGVKKY